MSESKILSQALEYGNAQKPSLLSFSFILPFIYSDTTMKTMKNTKKERCGRTRRARAAAKACARCARPTSGHGRA